LNVPGSGLVQRESRSLKFAHVCYNQFSDPERAIPVRSPRITGD